MTRLRPFYGLAALLIVWLIITTVGIADAVIMPSPTAILRRLLQMLCSGSFLIDIASTILRLLFGFVIGSVLGITVGVVMGRYAKFYESCSLLIDFLRSIPAMAFFPVFMVMFGLGEAPKIGITALIGGMIVLFNTIYGVRNSKKTRVAISRIMGASELQIFTKVVIPEALTEIFVGLRLSLSLSLIVVITTEMFSGTESGLGDRIINASYYLRSSEMYAAIFVAGVIGFLLNRSFHFIETRCIHWGGSR